MLKLLRSKTTLILLSIFVLTLFLRLYNLGDVPHGLHNDEVANTYGTRFILLNGQDMYGNKWPLIYLDKFGDYPPILPMYLSGLGTFIFGNNEFGSRSLIAIYGSLMVFPFAYLSYLIFRRKEAALFSAFLLAIAPVHIMLSRLNAEGIVALTTFITALAVFFASLEKKKYSWLVASFVLFLLTYMMYPSYRIILPLASLPMILLAWRYKVNKKFLISIGVFTLLTFATTVYISSTFWGKGRFEQTSFVSPISGVAHKLQQLIFNEKSIFVARMFHNKVVGYGFEIVYQYFRYFDPNYLFGPTGIPIIYQAPYSGLLSYSIIPLLIISMIGYFQNKNKKVDYRFLSYIFYLLLLAPLPAAFTVLDVPSIHRSLLFPFMVILIATYGYNALRDIKIKKFPVTYLFFFVVFFEIIFFTHNYFTHVSFFTSLHRNDGNKEAMQYIIDHKDQYDEVYVTNKELWLPSFYLFYANDYNPAYIGKFKENFRMDQIGKVYFPEMNCPSQKILEDTRRDGKLSVPVNTLIINNIDCQLDTAEEQDLFEKITTIRRLDFTDAFEIIRVKPGNSFSNPVE